MNVRVAFLLCSAFFIVRAGPALALPEPSGQEQTIASGVGCPDPVGGGAELRQYRVGSIRFETPFDFVTRLGVQLRGLALNQKEDELYDDEKVLQDGKIIAGSLGEGLDGFGAPVKLTVAIAHIENCRADTAPKTLDVVWSIYTSSMPFVSGWSFESLDADRRDPAASANVPRPRQRIIPDLRYNDTAGFQAGGAYVARDLGAVDELSVYGRGSSRSTVVETSVAGSATLARQWLRSIDWRANYNYTDEPTEQGQLERNVGGGQLTMLLRDFGGGGPSLRTGFVVEGGTLGAGVDPDGTSNEISLDDDYFGFKGFVGTTFRGYSQSFTASYGLQLAATGDGFGNGFRKHLGDVGYRVVFMPSRHTPWDLDIHFSAGAIEDLGNVPISERFFGGNVAENFISGDSWKIRRNPFIRSFSQNRLADTGSGPAIGGERFFSFNATFAPTVWKRPLLPAELINNDTVTTALEGQLNTATSVAAEHYVSRDPAMRRALGMSEQVERIRAAATELGEAMNSAADLDWGGLSDAFDECADNVGSTWDQADNLGQTELVAALALAQLVQDGGLIASVGGCLPQLRPRLGELDPQLGETWDGALDRLEQGRSAIAPLVAEVDQDDAEAKAEADLAFARRAVNTFLKELNLAAVAPVVFVDAARIGPQPELGGPGTRFGIGAGVRLSFVSTVHVTLGYAFNPRPQPGEEQGAFVAAFDITDLLYRASR